MTKIGKSKDEIEKQSKRMNFMGIPTSNADASRCAIKSFVERMSDKKSEFEERVITKADGNVKFMPRIPFFFEKQEDECKQTKATFRFKKAQPRGNDLKMLRVDKSLPWIQSEIDVVKTKKSEKSENHKKISSIAGEEESHENSPIVKNVPKDENRSVMKKSFSEIIVSKLQNQNAETAIVLENVENLDGDEKMHSIQSTLTLSSEGTYFSNDSGSYMMISDEKILKSQLNITKKFQVN
jgi:hypothetical protein